MAEGIGERSIHGIKEQKERLSDEELGNLLAAIGNNEAKAITLLIMRPDEIYTYGELFKEFLRAQGGVKGWQPNRSTPFRYCEGSLSPIGLVAKEALNPDLSTYGYSKTEYGKEIGDPLAGLLLDFSLRHPDMSLINIFGHTRSSAKELTISPALQFKKRAPIARLNIFRVLLQAPYLPITEAGLLEKIPSNFRDTNDLTSYLRPLSESGILSFRTTGENPRSFYRLAALVPEEDPPTYRRTVRLTKLVWHTIRDNPEKLWGAEDIIQHLTEQNVLRQRKGLASEISVILAHLRKKGYLDNLSLPHSEISINDTQREFLSELLTLLDKVQNRDKEGLETGKKLAERVRVSPGIISTLLRKAKEHSPNAQQQPPSETAENIKIILARHPNSTIREVREYLKQDFDKISGTANIEKILREHLRGQLVYEIDKGARRFSLAPKAEENTYS